MAAIEEAWKIFREADLVVSAERIDAAVIDVAQRLEARYVDRYPVVLCVMNGAVFFCGKLLGLLRFPLTFDYVHATRYGAGTSGGQVSWRIAPPELVRGRDVVLLDDILDAGETLRAIKARVLEMGASSCSVAVLANKLTGKAKPVAADFIGVDIPDRFVFGCGLDVSGYWRNLPAIYAVKGM